MSEIIRYDCMICGEEFDYEPAMCCSGRECGCMGQPTNPPICSQKCADEYSAGHRRALERYHEEQNKKKDFTS